MLKVKLDDHRLGDKMNVVFNAAGTFCIHLWVFSYDQFFLNEYAMVDDDVAKLGMTPDFYARQYDGILKV